LPKGLGKNTASLTLSTSIYTEKDHIFSRNRIFLTENGLKSPKIDHNSDLGLGKGGGGGGRFANSEDYIGDQTFAKETIPSTRVARFFLTQCTKMGGKYTKLPLN
jgi:hypothetical protein